MTYYQFTLIDYTFSSTGDEYTIDEPAGFDGFKIQLARDTDWHGIFSTFTVEALDIDGTGFDVLDAAYTQAGIDAEVVLRIDYSCEGGEFTTVYMARIDFGRSQRLCGDTCEWQVVLQPDSCINELRARYDQAVDLDSTTSFDGTTLEEYAFLGMEYDLPSKTIVLQSRGETEEQTSGSGGPSLFGMDIVPAIPNVIVEDLGNFAPDPTTLFVASGSVDDSYYFFEATSTGTYDIDFRAKGVLTIQTAASPTIAFVLVKESGGTTLLVSSNPSATEVTPNVWELEYDYTYSNNNESILDGGRLYFYFFIFAINGTYTLVTHTESFVDITQNSVFAPTPAKLYLAHEALSRTVEAVTDGCLKVKSNYFGRTDSSPYSFDTDGCGSLEALTNGLLIRRAKLQDGTNPKFTASFKSLYDGLKAIHAIGVGMETDPLTGDEIITIEPIKDYYTDDVILTVDNNNVVRTVEEEAHIGKINIGYSKWESEEFNGLDEFLTRREYRTTLKNAGGELNQLSNLIASGYAIEITRRKGVTTEDWRYDEDMFIVCLRRTEAYAQLMEVEQGNIDNAENILDPDTIYNFRLSPVRNLLRWLWYIMASYRNPSNESVVFSSGTANYIAKGLIDEFTCRIESEILQENQNVNLDTLDEYIPPIWFNERVTFTCPLAFSEFTQINENRNGLIAYICNDTTAYGWISRMEYDLQAGEAAFTLIPKRDA